MGVLGELEGVECACQDGLEVAEHRDDRFELRQLGRGLAAASDHTLVDARMFSRQEVRFVGEEVGESL